MGEERPVNASVLSLIGGILIIILIGGWTSTGVLLGIGVILSAVILYFNPGGHVGWSALIIGLSVFSLATIHPFSLNGYFFATTIACILGLIGGILGLIWPAKIEKAI